ncbi:MAG: hypothetical protein KDK91_05595 [Gammaproteobacteria bacterium]|nr:hypothetical protein [Gammaproteobacteria bacterium]
MRPRLAHFTRHGRGTIGSGPLALFACSISDLAHGDAPALLLSNGETLRIAVAVQTARCGTAEDGRELKIRELKIEVDQPGRAELRTARQ